MSDKYQMITVENERTVDDGEVFVGTLRKARSRALERAVANRRTGRRNAVEWVSLMSGPCVVRTVAKVSV